MRVAVAGGTGVVGRHVTDRLREAGHSPVVLSRSRGVDLTSGAGLDAALSGADAVIDVSNVTTTRASVAREFFTSTTRELLAAGRRAGVTHHVALSIIGVDRVDLGYYAGKRAQEDAVLGPDTNGAGTVLRAAQFHEFAGQVLDRTRGPIAVVPRMRTQPLAAREVAAALVELAAGPPVGMAPELAGPEEHELVDLARRILAARGQRRLILNPRLPGAAGRALADGALLPAGPAQHGQQTFDQWLTGPDGPSRDGRQQAGRA
jgi:uncharacterized protein YbjT (DUF2867 family)